MRTIGHTSFCSILLLAACNGTTPAKTAGSGGTVSAGGASSGSTSTNAVSGGVPGASTVAMGGAISPPGSSGVGGIATTGGALPAGGTPNTATSIIVGAGGSIASGGTSARNGGTSAVGGGGGSSAKAAGGTAVSGGSNAAGGSSSAALGGNSAGGATAVGSCGRPVGVCTAPTVKVTDVSLGTAVTGYAQEGDTDPLPLAISAMPSGGSRVAWLGTDKKVYIGQLDCDDKLMGTPFSFSGIDLQDIYADDSGGVVLLTRDATNGGTDNCGTGTLCGGTSSPCRTMWMVRFNSAGTVEWETQVTNLSSSLAGYQNGARFVWWYQHHGRIAFDGTNYAAYFGVAITVNNGSCVDIHEGDRMQVVGPTGALLTGHDSFEVGCSHSWQSRIVWDARSSHFAMVCATDNNCRIAQPNPYRTVVTATCDGTFFGGDLVVSSSSGYWSAWSQSGAIRLAHFTTGTSDTNIADAGSSAHPHLVPYGPGKMLLAWGTGTSMSAQVRDAGATGATIGPSFTIGVNDHNCQAFKPCADGSVAYPASGANAMSIRIGRVMPCN